ncbi:helix-turn-helix domain-containing protein [Amycolatopsis viridis]|uniref:Excisionase family DNA binding protein n=1 Tax=Amycolatopsis viridis TaxID=185678 RepID=A0ABX0SZG3_9PSEU|nr:helix-turn-helix domain-containing protein [Amycolatopsis viridis]NIH81322.1 excisionase family DNA binding protein [Amycolatopsis viridis]
MDDKLYSVDQIAEMLGLHVRTVRGYVREGRLKAVRIGKQYRIARDDLEEFTGRSPMSPAAEPVGRHCRVDVSSIVEIDAISAERAGRVTTMLMSAAAARGAGARQLHIETAYDEERARLKIVVLGRLDDSIAVLRHVDAVLS